jgi:hypothetical protein
MLFLSVKAGDGRYFYIPGEYLKKVFKVFGTGGKK